MIDTIATDEHSTIDVAVIGAGIAGLTAAHVVAKAGLRVLVLERNTFPGGRMSSEAFDGCIVDRGAYTLSGYAGRTFALAEEMGCRDRITILTPWAGYAHVGSVRHYRSDSMPAMALGVGLLPGDMIASLRMLQASKRLAPHLRLHKPDEDTFTLEQESAADYALRIGGPRLLERVAYPMISALYISDPENTSAVALLATLRYVQGIRLFNSPHGIGFLCDELARRVPVRFMCEVQSLTVTDGGVDLKLAASEETLHAKAAILTPPAPDTLHLLPEAGEPLATCLTDVSYTSCVVTAFVIQGRLAEKAFSIALPRDRFPLLASLTCEHNKHPARVPPDRDVLTAYSTAAGGERLLALDDEAVQAAVLREVEQVYPRLSDRVENCRIYRWPVACSQLRPGDLRRRKALQTALPHNGPLFLAGDYLVSSSSIEGSLVSGLASGTRAAQYADT